MSDRFPALIEIGGPIPRSLVPQLLARVQAFLRRRGHAAAAVHEFGECRLDIAAHRLSRVL